MADGALRVAAGRLHGPAPGMRLAVLADRTRPGALWVLPATGILTDTGFGLEPAVETDGKTPEDLAMVQGDTPGRIAQLRRCRRS